MTILEILELLIPFRAGITTAKHVRDRLQEVDLEALIAEYRTKEVVRPIKPAPDILPNNPAKEMYHAVNSEGRRCFDEHVRKERAQGFTHPDRGTSFAAQRSSGHCEECGELIIQGDTVVMRARHQPQQNEKK